LSRGSGAENVGGGAEEEQIETNQGLIVGSKLEQTECGISICGADIIVAREKRHKGGKKDERAGRRRPLSIGKKN